MGNIVLTLAWRGLQAVLWIMLFAFVALVALSRITPYEALVVRSGSMQPTIATGSIVIVDRAAHSPKVGAIVSFREQDGTVVTHRIVGIEAGRFITRGDANRSDDATHRSAASVYGTIVASVPLAGYVIHALQQPVAFLFLLFGSGGLLVLSSLRTIHGELIRLRRRPGLIDAD